MKNFFFASALTIGIAVFAFSCQGDNRYPGYEKENGSYFLLHKPGKGTTELDTGGAIFLKIKFKTEKDSVFLDINKETSRPSFPFKLTKGKFKGDYLNMFLKLHDGDSASFFVRLDSLKKNYPQEFEFHNPAYDTMTYLGFTVKVDSVYSRSKMKEVIAKQDEEEKRQMVIMQKKQAMLLPLQQAAKAKEPELKKKDKQLLKAYLAENKITAKPDEDGIYFQEIEPGTGDPVHPGVAIGMKYTGKYLDGSIFDSNELVPEEDPYYFRFGVDQMIPGFTKCLMQMKKGGTATFILPPKMAYNDSLSRVFTVKIVEMWTPPANQ